jgi:glycosidase
MLSLHRRLIELRRSTPALSVGGYTPVHTDDDLLVYERSSNGERRLVALNLSHAPRTLAWTEPGARIVLSTHLDREGEVGEQFELRADEGVVMGIGG